MSRLRSKMVLTTLVAIAASVLALATPANANETSPPESGIFADARCQYWPRLDGTFNVSVNYSRSSINVLESLNYRDTRWISTADVLDLEFDRHSPSTFHSSVIDRAPTVAVLRNEQSRADVPCILRDDFLPASCSLFMFRDGDIRTLVTIREGFGDGSLNFRDSRWIATADLDPNATSFEAFYDRNPTTAIIRKNGNRAEIPCTPIDF